MSKLTLPTIHLNGTSANVLYEDLANALGAMRAAIMAVEATAPNGRDYYPQGDRALAVAAYEHIDRIARLRSVVAELETLAEHIADARDGDALSA